ncbi:hypothetical protein LA080_013254 [Diaporthe eres]|nr:hypothetical protein LA080_013254 [Diaporthe eres]
MLKMQSAIASSERRRRRKQHVRLLRALATDRMPARPRRVPSPAACSHAQKGHMIMLGPDERYDNALRLHGAGPSATHAAQIMSCSRQELAHEWTSIRDSGIGQRGPN